MHSFGFASEGTRDTHFGYGGANQRAEMACEWFCYGPWEHHFFGSLDGLSCFLFKFSNGGFHGATGCNCDGSVGSCCRIYVCDSIEKAGLCLVLVHVSLRRMV